MFAYRNFEGTPDADVSEEVSSRIEEAIDEFTAGVNGYSVRDIGDASVSLAGFGNEYIQRNEPWNLVDDDPDAAAQVIRDCVQIAKALAVLFEPIAPEKAERLWDQLAESGSVHDVTVDDALVAPPGSFTEPEELFGKIPEERVEQLNTKLDERVADATDDGDGTDGDSEDDSDTEPEAAKTAGADLEPVANERIGFDTFQQLDLRVGRIESAEGIDGADDLARLTVDIGVESRQIVAGIKQLHDLDDINGQKVAVVANLEQAELFGVESNGMVLAAGEQADLLTTHDDAKPGEKIR